MGEIFTFIWEWFVDRLSNRWVALIFLAIAVAALIVGAVYLTAESR